MTRWLAFAFVFISFCNPIAAGEFDDLKARAESGDASAQNDLGSAYYNGDIVEQSDANAIDWYTRAAEQGNVSAQFNLASMYYIGTWHDDELALHFLTLAANQGHAVAQSYLSAIYSNADGVPRDYKKAYVWAFVAAASGADAAYQRNFCADKLAPAELQEAKAEADALLKNLPQLKR